MSIETSNYSTEQWDLDEALMSLGFKTTGLTASFRVLEEPTFFRSVPDNVSGKNTIARHQLIGDFELSPEKPLEQVALSFTPGGLRVNWENCGRLADLMARYFAPLCANQADTVFSAPDRLVNETRHAISFIANELIENAMKFHHNPTLPLSLSVRLHPSRLIITVSNSLTLPAARRFEAHLVELLAGDPGEQLIQKMEENALDLEGISSGLGILTILSDYQTKAGWKFERNPGLPDDVMVYSMVQLALN
ncbi:MAG TPA: ATP-binding protein [Chloroflexia bacterium]|nr:ATP-binding protein [Chloroflexia bacterium]